MSDAFLERLIEIAELKHLDRAGWVRRGVDRPESVAAHSWGVAWLVLVLCPPELNRERALAYAVLHDLPEVRVGDLTPQDAVPDKHARERAAANSLLGALPEALELWTAYEAQEDPEAQFVRQLDRLDMALQARAYARAEGLDPEEFLDSAQRGVTDPRLRDLLDRLRQNL